MTAESDERNPTVPTIYDVAIDRERPVTQSDVDSYQNAVLIMVKHRELIAFAEQLYRDALKGALPRDEYLSLIGGLFHSYTSQEAQQREADQREGEARRRIRESASRAEWND